MRNLAHHQDEQATIRDVVLVSMVMLTLVVPWFVEVDAVAWMALGGILAFAFVFPRSLLLAVPLAVGISFKQFEAGNMQLNPLEVLIVAAIAGYAPRAAITLWRDFDSIRTDPEAFSSKVMPDRLSGGIALLLLLAGLISLFTLADPDHARESLRTFRWTIFFPVAYFLLAAATLRGPRLRGLVAGLFLTGALLSALVAVVDGISGGGVQGDAVTRLSGLAPHPNALALLLERAAILGILIGVLQRGRTSLWWLGGSGIVAAVMLLTFSRGALLAVLVGCLLILILTRGRTYALAGAVAGAVVAGGLALAAPERTLSFLSGGSGSMRLELWRSSVAMIRDHPFSGVGLDQFLYQYLPRYVSPEAWPERFTSHPHNVLLDVWLSLGIIGLVILGFLAVFVVRGARAALACGDRIGLAAAGALAGGLVHGLVDQSYFLPELAVSTWILIMLLNRPDVLPERYGDSETQSKG